MTPDKHSRSVHSCLDCELLLPDYADGGLDCRIHEQVADHLDSCAACRAELGRELHLRGELGSLPVESCPDTVTARIMAAIAEEEDEGAREDWARSADRSRPWARLTPYLGWAAAAAAAAVLIWGPGPDSLFTTNGVPAGQPPAMALSAGEESVYTADEIAAAREELAQGLVLTMQYLDRTERSTLKEVFGKTLPRSLTSTLKTVINTPEGEQG
jgi:anti-sigma factor RsiW